MHLETVLIQFGISQFIIKECKEKYRYEVHPGVDPEQIRLKYTGARELKLDGEGELIIKTDFTDIRDERPLAFQSVKGQEKQITLRYSLNEEPLEGVYTVGFEIENYDHSKPLIIDPAIFFPLVPIYSDGLLVIPATLPCTPAPYDIPMQALIGWELSNLFVLEAR